MRLFFLNRHLWIYDYRQVLCKLSIVGIHKLRWQGFEVFLTTYMEYILVNERNLVYTVHFTKPKPKQNRTETENQYRNYSVVNTGWQSKNQYNFIELIVDKFVGRCSLYI